MLVWVWIAFLAIAVGISYIALFTDEDEIALIASAGATVLWIVLAYGSMNIETFSEQQDRFVVQSEPAIAFLMLGAVVVCTINALTVVFDWFGDAAEART